jgi:hypothetical protein
LPKEGVTYNLSQNLAKRTVTITKKWREGIEKKKHYNYQLKQLEEDKPAHAALLQSIAKNKEKRESEIVLEGNTKYNSMHLNMYTKDRGWIPASGNHDTDTDTDIGNGSSSSNNNNNYDNSNGSSDNDNSNDISSDSDNTDNNNFTDDASNYSDINDDSYIDSDSDNDINK